MMMNPATLAQDMLPPKTWVPLGIAYLAAALRANGFATRLKDLHDATWGEAATLIRDTAPDVLGISCFTFNRGNSLRLAAMARELLPEAFIVMGGAHATFFPEHVLDGGDVDAVVLGQGENTMVELVGCLARGEGLRAVPGLVYKREKQLVFTPRRETLADLDALPFPVYDAFDLSEYKSPEIPEHYLQLPGTHVISSRGCPYHCNFCSVNSFFGGRWSARSPGNVVDEVETLMRDHGVRHIYFSDDLFTLRRERTVGICKEIIHRKLELAWMAETRVDCVDAEMLRWMRQAGCYRIYYGVESGSPRILKSTNKGFTVEQVRTAFELTHKAGIEPCCFLMVGNPGENEESIEETIDLIRAIRPATTPVMGITTILPGTRHYEEAIRHGAISNGFWLSDNAPPLYTLEQDVDDLIALQIQLTKGISPELYEQMCALGFDDEYFRLRRMTKDW